MKKTTAILLAVFLCLGSVMMLASCGGKDADTTAEGTKPTTSVDSGTEPDDTQPDTAVDSGTEPDDTQADTQADTQPDTQTEPDGTKESASLVEDEIQLYEPRDTDHTPVSAANGTELACKFTVPADGRLTGLHFESCPSWNTHGESAFVVELYKWDNDYENTVVSSPLFTQEFTEWEDNDPCDVDFTDAVENGFQGGTYMWIFRGTTANIGIWAYDPSEDCEYFENGVTGNNGFRVVAYVLVPEE